MSRDTQSWPPTLSTFHCMYLLTVAHVRQRLVSFHLWFPPFPPFPPFPLFPLFLRFSVTPKLRTSKTPSPHYAVTQLRSHFIALFLCFFATSFSFSFISSPFYLFVSPLFRNSGTPILRFSDSPVLRFSSSPEFWSYGELFNLHFFTFFTFINGLMVVSFFASVISVPRDPVFQGPLFHRPWHVCKYI